MITVAKLKAQIQGKFEGGSSFTLNWNYIFRETGQALLQNIAPKKLRREMPIYGGYIDGVYYFYVPSDEVGAPIGIFNKLARQKYDYVAPQIFEEELEVSTGRRVFTILYKNGAQLLLINESGTNNSALVVADMSETTDVSSSEMTLSLNTYDFLTGTGSLQGTFTDTLNSLSGDFEDAPVDLTDYLFGTAMVSFKISDPAKVASIVLKLKTSVSDYWTLTFTEALDHLVEGYNFARVNMSEKVATGSPDEEDINTWELIITMDTGETQVVVIDNISIYTSSLYNFAFSSNKIFVDKDDLTRKVEPDDDGDLLDLTDEEAEIFKYEACRIVKQEGTVEKTTSKENFDSELSRKYALYYQKNPSDEMPMSYNQSPAISKSG